MKKVIGLTGMSGSGKSTVAAVCVSLGALLIDCDAIAHDALNDESVQNALASAFGYDIMKEDGSVDRRLLASRAFSDAESTQRLNSVTHPYILSELSRRLDEADDGVIVIDAPLLFNCGLDRLCTATVAVVADINTLASRISLRDGIDAADVALRLEAQKDMPKLLETADYIIENNSNTSIDDLKRVAANIYASIINNDN